MARKKKSNTLKINAGMIKWLWLSLISGMLFLAALFVLVSFTKMPDTQELENPQYEYSSIIYSSDASELGRYFLYNREWLSYDDLNPHLVNALVATEDERFYRHSGIDFRSFARAVVFMGSRGGASTITQQLAKLFFTQRSRSLLPRLWQKMKEWVIAVEFEKRYTKNEIIAMYLNKFDFLYNSHGVAAAANTYFGKDQKDLSVEEAAVLIGMLKNPSRYNPQRFPENMLKRRNVVLYQMVRNGMLESSTFDVLTDVPVDNSNFRKTVHYEGSAPYFRATLTSYLKKILDDKRYRKPDGSKYDIYADGLRIYTTINKTMQTHAENAMIAHMKELQKRYFNVWSGQDPWTYDATVIQRQIRNDQLLRSIEESGRYQKLRDGMMSEIFGKITDKFPDARLWSSDVSRMLREEKEPGYLNSLIRKDFISRKQAAVYRDILADPLWEELKTQKKALDGAVKKVFNTQTSMKVFAYNDLREKTETMTPLDSIKYHQKHMQLGSISIDPHTGHIKTWVGGIGNKYFQYDHVQSNRQVGSTFKPFVYATAIFNQGMSPCQKVEDIKHCILAGDPNFKLMETWCPSNSRGTFSNESMTLKEALRLSINSISVWLMKELGSVELVRSLVDNMGISKSKIPKAPSIVLGSADLNVLEMTGAYATFANYGVYNEPTFLTRIEDRNGRLIYSSVPEQRRVLPEKYNYVMVDMLKHAASAVSWQLKSEFGGKTGTTNDYVDGWFMGISPDLVVGTWVGGEHPWIRFKNLDQGQGGVMARPYFIDFMKRLENDGDILLNQQSFFRQPEGDRIEVDCSVYDKLNPQDSLGKDAQKVKVINDQFEEVFNQ